MSTHVGGVAHELHLKVGLELSPAVDSRLQVTSINSIVLLVGEVGDLIDGVDDVVAGRRGREVLHDGRQVFVVVNIVHEVLLSDLVEALNLAVPDGIVLGAERHEEHGLLRFKVNEHCGVGLVVSCHVEEVRLLPEALLDISVVAVGDDGAVHEHCTGPAGEVVVQQQLADLAVHLCKRHARRRQTAAQCLAISRGGQKGGQEAEQHEGAQAGSERDRHPEAPADGGA
mmetsp:Transcript_65050/g.90490  ORF Transcript_65050/g.90490 Transcript_65050/m.90490 type:complete len:228 (-) Transcript_65050:54-737(-)